MNRRALLEKLAAVGTMASTGGCLSWKSAEDDQSTNPPQSLKEQEQSTTVTMPRKTSTCPSFVYNSKKTICADSAITAEQPVYLESDSQTLTITTNDQTIEALSLTVHNQSEQSFIVNRGAWMILRQTDDDWRKSEAGDHVKQAITVAQGTAYTWSLSLVPHPSPRTMETTFITASLAEGSYIFAIVGELRRSDHPHRLNVGPSSILLKRRYTDRWREMTDDDRRLLPLRPQSESADTSPRILDLTSEDTELVLDAVSSTTARRILAALHNEPASPPEIAETLDLSLQNVHYHLRNILDAELIEEVGIAYSEKGVEMSIYAPSADPVVLSGSDLGERTRLRRVLKQMGGMITLFSLISVLAHWAVTRIELPLPPTPNPPVPGPEVPPAPTTPNPAPIPGTYRTPASSTPNSTPVPGTDVTSVPSTPNPTSSPELFDFGSSIPPGLIFFGGGMVMLVMVIGWWYYQRY